MTSNILAPSSFHNMFSLSRQSNEYLEEKLLQKGPTITDRSKKVQEPIRILSLQFTQFHNFLPMADYNTP